MTPFDRLVQFLTTLSFNPWGLLKILFLVAILIYIAFATIVVRQVGLMIKALNVELEALIKVIAWVHLGVAIGLFFLALIIL